MYILHVEGKGKVKCKNLNHYKTNNFYSRVCGISGYEGVFCHINIDECASQPCLNNGKCIDKINSYHCECPKGEKITGNVKDDEDDGAKEICSWILWVSF